MSQCVEINALYRDGAVLECDCSGGITRLQLLTDCTVRFTVFLDVMW